jgi:hypothetical protein
MEIGEHAGEWLAMWEIPAGITHQETGRDAYPVSRWTEGPLARGPGQRLRPCLSVQGWS